MAKCAADGGKAGKGTPKGNPFMKGGTKAPAKGAKVDPKEKFAAAKKGKK